MPAYLNDQKSHGNYPAPDWLVDYFKQKNTQILSFREWMNVALYHPSHGYYTQKQQLIGTLSGDFVTAPELTPLFGESIAQSIAPWLQACGNHILEFGPGRGKLAVDIYQSLLDLGIEASYTILELSPTMRLQQQQLIQTQLPQHSHRFSWRSQLPDSFCGVMLANEVLDAIPVDLIQIKHHQVLERCVEINYLDNQAMLTWHDRPAPNDLTQLAKSTIPETIFELCASSSMIYQTELHSLACSWLTSIARSLTRGALLMFDYGFDQAAYYHPQRHMGTINTHYQHRSGFSPLTHVGEQDITSHVNFSALYNTGNHVAKSTIKGCGDFQLAGYTRQHHFLIQSGLLDLAQKKHHESRGGVPLQTALNLLLGEHEMGELFKVMAFVSDENLLDLCPGFFGRDDSGLL